MIEKSRPHHSVLVDGKPVQSKAGYATFYKKQSTLYEEDPATI